MALEKILGKITKPIKAGFALGLLTLAGLFSSYNFINTAYSKNAHDLGKEQNTRNFKKEFEKIIEDKKITQSEQKQLNSLIKKYSNLINVQEIMDEMKTDDVKVIDSVIKKKDRDFYVIKDWDIGVFKDKYNLEFSPIEEEPDADFWVPWEKNKIKEDGLKGSLVIGGKAKGSDYFSDELKLLTNTLDKFEYELFANLDIKSWNIGNWLGGNLSFKRSYLEEKGKILTAGELTFPSFSFGTKPLELDKLAKELEKGLFGELSFKLGLEDIESDQTIIFSHLYAQAGIGCGYSNENVSLLGHVNLPINLAGHERLDFNAEAILNVSDKVSLHYQINFSKKSYTYPSSLKLENISHKIGIIIKDFDDEGTDIGLSYILDHPNIKSNNYEYSRNISAAEGTFKKRIGDFLLIGGVKIALYHQTIEFSIAYSPKNEKE